ncbi:hypothetical protein [Neisseria meningitidis]|uniref:hypothetical protein n=1 Tax=Neisseria meningitidis TaxID=487 RepID=UPI001C8F5DCA|nr:hypothetical protein [Neisseria meningitidis]
MPIPCHSGNTTIPAARASFMSGRVRAQPDGDAAQTGRRQCRRYFVKCLIRRDFIGYRLAARTSWRVKLSSLTDTGFPRTGGFGNYANFPIPILNRQFDRFVEICAAFHVKP